MPIWPAMLQNLPLLLQIQRWMYKTTNHIVKLSLDVATPSSHVAKWRFHNAKLVFHVDKTISMLPNRPATLPKQQYILNNLYPFCQTCLLCKKVARYIAEPTCRVTKLTGYFRIGLQWYKTDLLCGKTSLPFLSFLPNLLLLKR